MDHFYDAFCFFGGKLSSHQFVTQEVYVYVTRLFATTDKVYSHLFFYKHLERILCSWLLIAFIVMILICLVVITSLQYFATLQERKLTFEQWLLLNNECKRNASCGQIRVTDMNIDWNLNMLCDISFYYSLTDLPGRALPYSHQILKFNFKLYSINSDYMLVLFVLYEWSSLVVIELILVFVH